MNKNRIRLTESDLHRIVKESVNKVLTELDWKTYMNAARARQSQGNTNAATYLSNYSNQQFNKQHFGDKGYYGSNQNGNSAMLQGAVNTKGGEMHDTRDYGANFDGTMSTTKASGKQIHGFGKDLVGKNGYDKQQQQRYAYDKNNLNGLNNVTNDYKQKIQDVGNDLDGYYNGKSQYVNGRWQ